MANTTMQMQHKIAYHMAEKLSHINDHKVFFTQQRKKTSSTFRCCPLQVGKKYKTATGSHKKQEVLGGQCSMIICEDELVNVQQLEEDNLGLHSAVKEWEKNIRI